MAIRKSTITARRVLLDTQGLIALLNTGDMLHAKARELWARLGRDGYFVTPTDWIIAETGNGLVRTRARRRFPAMIRSLRTSKRVQIVFVTEQLLHRALSGYESRTDKSWGLVDCASFEVMKDNEITEAFTDDKHFKQAGLRCLLV